MFKKMKLGTKLMIAFLAVGVIPFAAVGLIALMESSDALTRQAYGQLEAVRGIKKAEIEKYFLEREGDMGVLMETVANLRQEAFHVLEAVQENKEAEVEGYFDGRRRDAAVLSASDRVVQALQEFEAAFEAEGGEVGGSFWKSAEAKYADWFERYQQEYGYHDLFLVAEDGDVVFTTTRESDLGQNAAQGALADSPLGRCFEKSLQGVAIQDFEPYAPSDNRYAAFVGAPVRSGGAVIGTVILQLPSGPMNEIVQRRHGMGETGETYLVGRHRGKTAFRSDMLTMGDGKYAVGYEITTPYIEEVFETRKGFEHVYTDSKGKLVMVAADPLDIEGLDWAVISKIDLQEAIAPTLRGDQEDFYTKYVQQYGYYDLFLIHPEGEVFYSVAKEADYGTNMVNGEYADSGLGKLVRRVLEQEQFGFADFEPYAPSNGEPAAFIARPVIHEGGVELIVALQLPLSAINSIMQEREGMGETGETYLVGPDHLMRSDSYLDPEHHSVQASFADPGQGSVKTEAARKALAGETGEGVITDYNGHSVLSAYAPIDLWGTRWALLAEIDKAEAFAAVITLEWLIGIVAAVGIAAIVLVALFIARSISNPIKRIIEGLNEGSDQVASASGQVSAASQSLAEGASEQAASIEETSSSLEEISSMTKQNADHAGQANSLMDETKQVVGSANASMTEMVSSMQEITKASEETSKIIKTIDEIAFQTNLLALNAAVEAARAGEAGAGFAVVADEVRNLALRAAEAARNTSNLIEGTTKKVQDGSTLVERTSEEFGKVDRSAAQVADLVGEIAAASREQSDGIDQVNQAVADMDKVTQQNAANAEESASSSEEMNAQAEQMKQMVNDLVVLVEGAAELQAEKASKTPPEQGRTKASLTQGGTGEHAAAKPAKSSGKEVNPERAIPFDEKDSKDSFQDF
jgi:methyl-accepting chemotaxis protein